ncbi:AMIN domain-containing protein [Actinomyces viscosus]|uniref:AMIN-like domain-containing protein n=1 Tax=Actinomyces viscosus TaxID=1656 RepID=A0A448PI12_ACTVI|nr:AMIN domain-containing protein [Actinomyces viscosus]TFH53512.1 AMIN domain-containing protein [Actinomyces viscosus]VEI14532.1 Uncharacterised protein [Actinomyces viscosus]
MPHRRPVIPLTLLAGTAAITAASTALALSACSVSTSSASPSSASAVPGGSGAPATAATQTAPPTHPHQNSSDAPDWGTGSRGQQAAEGSTLTVADVRVGNHPDEGYSRFVVEFDGQGTPGWSQPQWDIPASTMGKGDPIEVEGDHTMVIRGSGVAAVPPEGQRVSGHRQIELDDSANDDRSIDSAYIDPGFEGEFQVVLGTDSQTYRVFSLSNPTRLVVDIAH